MNEIKLLVDDKHLEVVLSILENLKVGLIDRLEINEKVSKVRRVTQYQLKTNTIIKEEESGTADKSGKYASAAVYKDRVKRKK